MQIKEIFTEHVTHGPNKYMQALRVHQHHFILNLPQTRKIRTAGPTSL